MREIVAVIANLFQQNYSEISFCDWQSFQDHIAKEEDCIGLLAQARWPNGYCCPRCDHNQAYVIQTRRLPLYQCIGCRHQTSLAVGTIMENSRIPVSKWLFTLYLVSLIDREINAMQLQQRIQVTYKTAWAMLHAIRQAISCVDSERLLSGNIKGSVGFCGQIPYKSTSTRDPQEKPVIFCASIDEQEQPTAFKMQVVRTDHMKNKHLEWAGIQEFTKRYVKSEGSGVQFFQRFAFYKLRPVKELFDQTIRSFKQSYRGLSSRHLQLYLDKACFKINLRLQNVPIFESLIELCMSTQRTQPHKAA